jgi:hypothetical protein
MNPLIPSLATSTFRHFLRTLKSVWCYALPLNKVVRIITEMGSDSDFFPGGFHHWIKVKIFHPFRVMTWMGGIPFLIPGIKDLPGKKVFGMLSLHRYSLINLLEVYRANHMPHLCYCEPAVPSA